MVEYHLNKEPKVASNVFELGLKQFDKDMDFVLRYLDFLINTNDDASELLFPALTAAC
jgi:cleavage stimulation factor subunit 3